MKPYQTIPITECGEPLAPIPSDLVALTEPHPYAVLGAPYGGANPWRLRQSVLAALLAAQTALATRQPGWKLRIFDALRPTAVQEFMFWREYRLASGGRGPEDVPEAEHERFYNSALRVWAPPSRDAATPPPHSTGAALDLTIIDGNGQEIWMGSPIDENSDRSNPDYFATTDPEAHTNRQLLLAVMAGAGFRRHPAEWWHFSLGDQFWAWLTRQADPASTAIARYGRADLLPVP